MKIIFLFSGQGSQYYHMGSKLLGADDTFRKHMYELDEINKSTSGISVIDTLYNPKHKLFDPFVSLRVTHPAIYMVEYSLVKVLEKKGIIPDYVLGSSLGEFSAATVAEVFNNEEAIKLIIKQAEVIEASCEAGSMVAILENADIYHGNPEIRNNCTIASINGPSQFVISGERDKMAYVKKVMKDKETLHQELMVSYGFHSSAIDPAENAYKSHLANQIFSSPKVPMISGMSGKVSREISESYFWDIIRKPTLYNEAITSIENSMGMKDELLYIDLGPSGSLANLIRYNVKKESKSKAFQIMSPFQQEFRKLEELISYHEENKKTVGFPSFTKEYLTAYVFPGQGSQKKGMGENLFDIFPTLTESASEILGYSIKELCIDNPGRNLNLTQFTQPALYVVNAMSYLKLKEETDIGPDFIAGHSLGEFNALFAAGGFDFETGLRLVQKRGVLMAKMQEGGMAAIKGLSAEEIGIVIEQNGLEEIDVANYNTQNQIVISGPRDLIAKCGRYFESAGASLYFPLNVSGAFHSRYMKPAKTEFESFLSQFEFSPLKIPVVSNVEASFYTDSNVKTLLADQLINPVRWTESISFMMRQGDVTFKEIGPGDVLTKLIWRIKQDLQEAV